MKLQTSLPFRRFSASCLSILVAVAMLMPAGCGHGPSANRLENQVAEVSCGQCQFGMGKSGCDLAIRVNGQSLFVDGSSIDDHGDAHAADGLCNCIRQARVTGDIVGDRFVASSVELLPVDTSR